MKQKHLLLIRSGYPAKEFVLKELQDLGYYVVILDKEKSCPDAYANDWILADVDDENTCVEAVKEYLSKDGNYLDGALTFWEEVVLTVAKITETFGWAGIPFDVASKIKNKYKFRAFCKENGLPTANHAILNNPNDIPTIANQLTFPLVVKPIYGACSAFVIKVDSENELQSAYKVIQKYIRSFWLTPEWKNTDLYVEEYIDGQEVDMDIILQDGKIKFWSMSDNFQTHEPFFVETGQAIPSRLPTDKQTALISMAEQVLTKLGVGNGVIHFEAKYSSQGPVPIEINLRMGGDEVYMFVKQAWGADMVEYAARIAVGDKVNITKPKQPLKYLQGQYFLPTSDGTLNTLEINEEIYGKSYLKQLNFFKKVGDTVLTPPQDFDYLGWVTVTGHSSEEAEANLQEALENVTYSISPYAQDNLQETI